MQNTNGGRNCREFLKISQRR